MQNFVITLIIVLGLTACGEAGAIELNEGNVAFEQADYSTAMTAYREAQEAAPQNPEPLYNMGNTHYRQQDYDLAEMRALQSIQNATDESLREDALFNLGNSYFNLGELDKAISAYEEVLWLNPAAEDARHNLALALLMREQQEANSDQEQQSDESESSEEEQESSEGDEQSDEGEQESSDGQEESDEEEESQETDPQSGDEGDESGEEEDESESAPSDSNEEGDENQPQTEGQTPADLQPLTLEQAAQLLESAAQNSETLQQFLQNQQAPSQVGSQDW